VVQLNVATLESNSLFNITTITTEHFDTLVISNINTQTPDLAMSPSRVDDQPRTNLLYRSLHGRAPEQVVRAKGSYLWLDDGRK
jgi:hypothetical protein